MAVSCKLAHEGMKSNKKAIRKEFSKTPAEVWKGKDRQRNEMVELNGIEPSAS